MSRLLTPRLGHTSTKTFRFFLSPSWTTGSSRAFLHRLPPNLLVLPRQQPLPLPYASRRSLHVSSPHRNSSSSDEKKLEGGEEILDDAAMEEAKAFLAELTPEQIEALQTLEDDNRYTDAELEGYGNDPDSEDIAEMSEEDLDELAAKDASAMSPAEVMEYLSLEDVDEKGLEPADVWDQYYATDRYPEMRPFDKFAEAFRLEEEEESLYDLLAGMELVAETTEEKLHVVKCAEHLAARGDPDHEENLADAMDYIRGQPAEGEEDQAQTLVDGEELRAEEVVDPESNYTSHDAQDADEVSKNSLVQDENASHTANDSELVEEGDEDYESELAEDRNSSDELVEDEDFADPQLVREIGDELLKPDEYDEAIEDLSEDDDHLVAPSDFKIAIEDQRGRPVDKDLVDQLNLEVVGVIEDPSAVLDNSSDPAAEFNEETNSVYDEEDPQEIEVTERELVQMEEVLLDRLNKTTASSPSLTEEESAEEATIDELVETSEERLKQLSIYASNFIARNRQHEMLLRLFNVPLQPKTITLLMEGLKDSAMVSKQFETLEILVERLTRVVPDLDWKYRHEFGHGPQQPFEMKYQTLLEAAQHITEPGFSGMEAVMLAKDTDARIAGLPVLMAQPTYSTIFPNLMTPDPILDSRDILDLPATPDSPFHNRVIVRNHQSFFHEAALKGFAPDLIEMDDVESYIAESGEEAIKEDPEMREAWEATKAEENAGEVPIPLEDYLDPEILDDDTYDSALELPQEESNGKTEAVQKYSEDVEEPVTSESSERAVDEPADQVEQHVAPTQLDSDLEVGEYIDAGESDGAVPVPTHSVAHPPAKFPLHAPPPTSSSTNGGDSGRPAPRPSAADTDADPGPGFDWDTPESIKFQPEPPEPNETLGNLFRYCILSRTTKQQTGKGTIRSRQAFFVVGNQDGLLGIGSGKVTQEEGGATKYALMDAFKKMDYVERFEKRTIWTEMRHKFRSTYIIMRPRPVGFGLRCHPTLYMVLKAAGFKDVSAKVWGSRNPLQVAYCALRMLHGGHMPHGMGDGFGGKGRKMWKGSGMKSRRQIELSRGRRLVHHRK